MHPPATTAWAWQQTQQPGPPGIGGERTIWRAHVPGLRYPDGTPVEINAELGPDGEQWFVTDNFGALGNSQEPAGVIGTLMSRTEGFFAVDMTGDGHFYLMVPHEPARSRWARIEEAAMQVAVYSAFMGWAGQPPGWPPQIVITMTIEQAIKNGVYPPHG